jgi:rubrerythrin
MDRGSASKPEEEQRSGLNRTGIMANPDLSLELIEGTKQITPQSDAEQDDVIVNRASYFNEGAAIGSPPLPINGTAELTSKPDSRQISVLLDKLGERLAFERQGTRLYEAFSDKLHAKPVNGDGPTPEDLRHICDEELDHFKLLQKAIMKLDGDPTVLTPSADVAGVLSHGVLEIVTDPRTTIVQTLQAMLNAELADNDGWEMLADLASELGHAELAEQCEKAFEQEQEHLANVRAWLAAMTLQEAAAESGLPQSDDTAGEESGGAKSARKRGASKRHSKGRTRSRQGRTSKKRKK